MQRSYILNSINSWQLETGINLHSCQNCKCIYSQISVKSCHNTAYQFSKTSDQLIFIQEIQYKLQIIKILASFDSGNLIFKNKDFQEQTNHLYISSTALTDSVFEKYPDSGNNIIECEMFFGLYKYSKFDILNILSFRIL